MSYLEYGGNPLLLKPVPSLSGTVREDSYLSKKKKKKRNKKNYLQDETIVYKRIDYVLVYKPEDTYNMEIEEKTEYERRMLWRETFEKMIQEDGLEIEECEIGTHIFVKIHCPFKRLCEQAEDMKIQMPLKNASIIPSEPKGCVDKFWQRFVTDTEIDFVSAPFTIDKRDAFEGIDNPDTFFRPATRAVLVESLLLNVDCVTDKKPKDRDSMRRQGLPFMIMKGAYCDAFIFHEESPFEYIDDDEKSKLLLKEEKIPFDPKLDPREDMQRTWVKFFKFQPMWKIRNYFGEKIALYFAWIGCMTTMLWLPMLLGVALWIYGLLLSIDNYRHEQDLEEQRLNNLEILKNELEMNISLYNSSEDISRLANVTTEIALAGESISDLAFEMLTIFKDSFDSKATPFYALIICLWGTVFLEIWKRTNAKLAYEWDVDQFEVTEPDRPQFYGTKERPDPVSDLPDWYYPFYKQFLKFITSFSILVFMASLVVASAISVILYRLIMSYLFRDGSSIEQLLYASLTSTVLNSACIMTLGKVYEYVAYKLTDWENHRTQTMYEDALIIKLFAFQFVNSYTSLFYIAFFRDLTTDSGFLNMGERFVDPCDDNNCMSLLSLQVFVLMLMKPFPKFLKDLILPFLKKLWRRRKCCRKAKVAASEKIKIEDVEFIEKERLKPPVKDFTLWEYNEKIIMYGYLMLFSSALPLAPLIQLLTNVIDIRVDAKRLLWFNRRPVPYISQDIGMWFAILNFLNIAGVISNAFIISFTAQWGQDYDQEGKLWIVLIFEHIVFAFMFFLAYAIPDTPREVSLAIRKERYQVNIQMDDTKDKGDLTAEESATKLRKIPTNLEGYNYFKSTYLSNKSDEYIKKNPSSRSNSPERQEVTENGYSKHGTVEYVPDETSPPPEQYVYSNDSNYSESTEGTQYIINYDDSFEKDVNPFNHNSLEPIKHKKKKKKKKKPKVVMEYEEPPNIVYPDNHNHNMNVQNLYPNYDNGPFIATGYNDPAYPPPIVYNPYGTTNA
ncbi:anoctamin-7-like isoform X2 [Anneissia japonica]|uniref:anoctamin-7-like isoform X2 n=1 Tax=Anneissia japonica TaxID=1529436 RepID=UPI001425AC12|nr:anoctamin-7-like isoform X2 [Anneissia japonica]